MLSCVAHDPLRLCFGDVSRVLSNDTVSLVVNVEHYLRRFCLCLVKEVLENMHHELHGGVIIVVQDHAEPSRLSRLGPFSDGEIFLLLRLAGGLL